jgi:hypothetical protein
VKEDYSYKGLTDGWELRPVTKTEKVSSIVTEKMKSLKLPERLRNLSITYSELETWGEPPKKHKSHDDDQT